MLLQRTSVLLALLSLLGIVSSHEEVRSSFRKRIENNIIDGSRQNNHICAAANASGVSFDCSFFTTKAKLDISWVGTPEAILLTVKDLNSLSEMVAPYLQQLLSQEETIEDDMTVMDVTMKVTDHKIELQSSSADVVQQNKKLYVETEVTTWYLHHEPLENFAASLEEALVRNNGLATVLQDVALVQPDATDFLVGVSTIRQDTEVLYSLPDPAPTFSQSAASKGLIAACILLVMALIFVSSVLVWIAGGCPMILEKGRHYAEVISDNMCCCILNRSSGKEDIDNATTASGILGARPSYDEYDHDAATSARESHGSNNENQMPAGFTPNRGVFREQDCDDSQILTPMSTNTDFSTTSSRVVPLGIAPANFKNNMLTQRHQTPEKSPSYIPNHQLTYT